MTRICAQCGNRNDDTQKFCTSCGNALGLSGSEPGSAPVTQPFCAAPSALSGRNNTLRIIAIAATALLVILAGLYFLQASGTVKILPFPSPAETLRPTPAVTSFIEIRTPLPVTTETEISPNMTNVTDTPSASPTIPKAVVCPSDRRACGSECADTMTDLQNCGGCNVSCGLKETCQEGHCMPLCGGTRISCPDGGCHDLEYDTQNCGACGNSCPVGLVCNKSTCTPPLKTVIPTYMG